MINNRPRGVFQNKNAANIQLAGAINKSVGLSLHSANTQNHQIDNLFEKLSQRELSQVTRVLQTDSENITLASLKSVHDPYGPPLKASMLENFNKQALNNINLLGHNSPKEPSPPKLKSYSRQSLLLVNKEDAENKHQIINQDNKQQQTTKQSNSIKNDILIDISEENEDDNIVSNNNNVSRNQQQDNYQIQQVGLEKKRDKKSSKDHQPENENEAIYHELQPSVVHVNKDDSKPKSGLSRIPRLSLRFSNAPPSTKNDNDKINDNLLKQRTNRISAISNANKPITRANLASENKLRPRITKETLKQVKENDEQDDVKEIEDIDNSTSRDAIFLVCDVAKDIFNYLYDLEDVQSVQDNYLRDQRIMTPKVRQRLINWCIEINSQLKLLPETLYLTIAIIDRFFDKFVVERQNQVQLFASAATLIASKYEEIYPPEVRDLVYLTQSAYSKLDILRAEMYLLKLLDFDLGKPIPLTFLRRFSKAAHCNLKMHSVAKYIMELSLTEYECSHWKPSLLAAASLFTSLFLVAAFKTEIPSVRSSSFSTRSSLAPLSSSSSNVLMSSGGSRSRVTRCSLTHSAIGTIVNGTWTKQMVHYSRYDKEQLYGPASVLCKILRRAQKSPSSFYCAKKYAQEIAKWPELKTTKVDDLIKIGEQY